MKYLVVSSDDFGMCHSVNAGILRGFRKGILRSASIMAPAPWFDEAAALAVAHKLPVGVHLVATCDWDRYRWRSLTPCRSFTSPDGTFGPSSARVVRRADRGELEAEWSAQIELVLSKGIQPTHLDCHMRQVFDADLQARLCRKYGIPTRNITIGKRHPDAVIRLDSPVISASSRPGSKKAFMAAWLKGLGDGYHALIVHAAQASEELAAMTSRESPGWKWTQPYRQTDLALILDRDIAKLIGRLGIKLVSFGDCPAALRDDTP